MREKPVSTFSHDALPLAADFIGGLRRWIGSLSLAAIVCFGAVTQTRAGDFTVGVAGPMTGPLAFAGKQYRAAVEQAAREINATGGLNGDRMVVVAADDQATPKGGLAAAKILVGNKVSAVIGHYNSTPALAAAGTYTENGVLLIAPQAIIGKLTGLKAWNIFRLAPRADAQAAAAASYLISRAKTGHYAGSKRIAIVHDTSAFGRSLAELAGQALKKAGMPAVLLGEIPSGTRQTGLIINRLADRIASAKAGAVYWTGGGPTGGRFLTALRKQTSPALFIGTEILTAPEFVNGIDPGAVAGVRMTVPANTVLASAAKAILEKLDMAEDTEDPAPAIAAWTAMQVLIQASRTARSNASRDIAAALHSGKPFLSVIGPVSFDANGDRREHLYRIYRWEKADDGKLVFAPEATSTTGERK